jgi:hypothetical protein
MHPLIVLMIVRATKTKKGASVFSLVNRTNGFALRFSFYLHGLINDTDFGTASIVARCLQTT